MEIRKVKDLIKLIKYSKEPTAVYLDYLSGNKCKHVLWKYDDYTCMLSRLPSDLESKGFFPDPESHQYETLEIENVEVCMNLLDSKRFIKVFITERSLID